MQINLKLPSLVIYILTLGMFSNLFTRINSQNENYNRIRRDFDINSNVNCISHDTKFTCDCQNVNEQLTLPNLQGGVFHIEIKNCKSLLVNGNSLKETFGLRTITFKNISNLILKQNSLSFPLLASNTPLIIGFEKVNFEMIDSHAINGNIEEISFIMGHIEVIKPFAFATLNDRAMLLKIDHIQIERIEPQAFKKFSIHQMEIMNTKFTKNLPSKSFYDLEISNFLKISNVTFRKVHSKAFIFKDVGKFIILNNNFEAVDSEWLDASIRENSLIKGNNFGLTSSIAFKGINVHRDYKSSEKLELKFYNNSVKFLNEPRPLQFNEDFLLNIHNLNYQNYFFCNEIDTTNKPYVPKVLFFKKFSDAIYFQRPTNNNQSLVLSKIIEFDCTNTSYLFYILLIIIGIIIIIILITAFISYRLAKKRKKRKMDIVLPEPRTYKETQIIYQIENAGLLKTDL